ncbi:MULTISPECIES: DMT family transporter [Rhodopseudomonas]|uniref:DMT family transporter n=1 Tax=Rhodopseudomonas TaxID=1073 RepID=UPI0005CB5E3F|nr:MULTISPECIES: DMT family transporter [Rhodopseudomonas]MDF3813801.1 DMT family transporter [Rhodopseudomonas sp. BAL398]WOK19680.1 DMT family transporter [Rhodopseudomonas sp. BAL398]
MTTTSPTLPDAGRGPTHRHADHPLRGIALIVGSTVFLACSDTLAKYLSLTLPALEIAWIRFLVFVLIMIPVVVMSPQPSRVLRSTRPGLQALRGLALVLSSILFISGLRYLPIAAASATSFVAPLFVTALSIVFLSEKVGVRRWAATLTGLIGVLIVVRPGTASFNSAAIFPIMSALAWACTLIMTRLISGADRAITTMAISALVGFLLLSALAPLVWIAPTWHDIMIGIAVGVASTTGQWLVVLAFRYGDASVLAPFSYTQLLWASILGFLVFAEIPVVWTFVGASLIIASGIYTAHRERMRRLQQLATEPYPSA